MHDAGVSPDPDLAGLATALGALFPELAPLPPLRPLGAGFHSTVVETPDGRVFRIGKTPAAAAGYAREVRLLPVLRGRVPVAVPGPRWYAPPSVLLPYGVLGYPKLPGTPLTPARLRRADAARLAAGVAGFLLALRRFPPEEMRALGLPGPPDRQELEAARDAVLAALQGALTAAEHAAVRRWWAAFLGDEAVRHAPLALVHGDLWYENLLVDVPRSTVVGVLDFEDTAVGDPARDVAALLHLGETFVARVLAACRTLGAPADAAFRHRVRRWWAFRELGGVPEDPAEWADWLRKVRAGPVLRPEGDSGGLLTEGRPPAWEPGRPLGPRP